MRDEKRESEIRCVCVCLGLDYSAAAARCCYVLLLPTVEMVQESLLGLLLVEDASLLASVSSSEVLSRTVGRYRDDLLR